MISNVTRPVGSEPHGLLRIAATCLTSRIGHIRIPRAHGPHPSSCIYRRRAGRNAPRSVRLRDAENRMPQNRGLRSNTPTECSNAPGRFRFGPSAGRGAFPWRPAVPSAGRTRQRMGPVFESPGGHTVGLGGRFGIQTLARRVLVTKAQLGSTLPANHQTKQRYNTGQGLTWRAKLSNDINE
jgi:hypothetical protein